MNTLTKTGGAMNHAKEFLADLSAAFASLDDRRREAEDAIQSGRRCACIACDQPLTAGTVEVTPVIDLRHSAIWMVAVHRDCAEQFGDALSDVIQRKLDGEAVTVRQSRGSNQYGSSADLRSSLSKSDAEQQAEFVRWWSETVTVRQSRGSNQYRSSDDRRTSIAMPA